MRFTALAIVVVMFSAACSAAEPETVQVEDVALVGAEAPELAVSAVIRAIGAGDAEVLDAMTVTDQLGLVALVEGATPSEAEAALGFASEQVAATFWTSFATGIEGFLEAGVDEIRIGSVSTLDVQGARYATVEVEFPLDAAKRVFVVTDQEGWRVDLIATFPGAFVSSIPFAYERATSPGVEPLLAESILIQNVSLDALEAMGVADDIASQVVVARAAINP